MKSILENFITTNNAGKLERRSFLKAKLNTGEIRKKNDNSLIIPMALSNPDGLDIGLASDEMPDRFIAFINSENPDIIEEMYEVLENERVSILGVGKIAKAPNYLAFQFNAEKVMFLNESTDELALDSFEEI